jgi:hypothetical protein
MQRSLGRYLPSTIPTCGRPLVTIAHSKAALPPSAMKSSFSAPHSAAVYSGGIRRLPLKVCTLFVNRYPRHQERKMASPALLKTVRAITLTLDETLAFYETYVPSAKDAALIERINKSGVHPAFNAISDALHRETILGLCRIWDTRRDTANLKQLAAKFRDAKVLAGLRGDGHTIPPTALEKWLAAVDSGSKCEEFLALKRARDRALAHTATPNQPYTGNAQGAKYGDERKMLERTIPLVETAGNFIGYSYVAPFADQRMTRQDFAKKFWNGIGT